MAKTFQNFYKRYTNGWQNYRSGGTQIDANALNNWDNWIANNSTNYFPYCATDLESSASSGIQLATYGVNGTDKVIYLPQTFVDRVSNLETRVAALEAANNS